MKVIDSSSEGRGSGCGKYTILGKTNVWLVNLHCIGQCLYCLVISSRAVLEKLAGENCW